MKLCLYLCLTLLGKKLPEILKGGEREERVIIRTNPFENHYQLRKAINCVSKTDTTVNTAENTNYFKLLGKTLRVQQFFYY